MDLHKNGLLDKPNDEAVRELLPDPSEREVRGILEAEARSYRGRAHKAGPILGLGDLLEEGRGMRLVLVTDAPRSAAEESLEAPGHDDAFDAMVFAEEVGAEKPDPALYEEARDGLDR